MAEETRVQHLIHSLEQGILAVVVRTAMFTALIVALTLLYLFVQFRGLPNEAAMDQAQIARNMADGNGFTTNFIRPIAIWQLASAKKDIPTAEFPELNQAPLWPFVNSLIFRATGASAKMDIKDVVYIGDRVIAASAIFFFLLSVGIGFFLARRLFDTRLALVGSAAVLLTDLCWQFSLSGLPQMLMLFLFMLALYATVEALKAQEAERRALCVVLVGVAAILLGLLTLAHGLGFWVFLGYAVFAALAFQPRVVVALMAVALYLGVVSPWLIRNYAVSDNPFGVAGYTLATYRGAEASLTRSLNPDMRAASVGFKNKLRTAFTDQANTLFANLGANIAALAFFFSLLHPFRNRVAASFRWAIFSMWIFSAFGMALFDAAPGPTANQITIIFLPVMVYFGFAFLLVLWGRLDFNTPLLRLGFLGVVLFAISLPLIFTLFAGSQGRVQWPPYIPPYIGILGKWTEPEEVLCSDMPWAVAWYADRKCLLLPDTVSTFNEISDYRLLGRSIVGLYLTPVTGNRPFISEIVKGPYKEWAGFIMRTVNLRGFSLQSVLPLPIEGECVFYADRNRWDEKRE